MALIGDVRRALWYQITLALESTALDCTMTYHIQDTLVGIGHWISFGVTIDGQVYTQMCCIMLIIATNVKER